MAYYGIDFGGSNLRISRVDPDTGNLIGALTTYAMQDLSSNEELIRLVMPHIPDGSNVGISAAGVVDEENLVASPVNSPIKSKITFGRALREKKGCAVKMTNDMNAAVQAAARYDQGKGYDNVLLATYSSGYNCALTRRGRNVTTAELGHIVYKPSGDLYCGCGGKGHLETYVSGNGAAAMAKQYLGICQLKNHAILDCCLADYNSSCAPGNKLKREDLKDPRNYASILQLVSAKHVYAAYAQQPADQPQQDIRKTQVEAIADSFGKMNSAYHPVDVMVLMGSQTLDWDILFVPAIEKYCNDRGIYQLVGLPRPLIKRAHISEIGLAGAVAYFLSYSNQRL